MQASLDFWFPLQPNDVIHSFTLCGVFFNTINLYNRPLPSPCPFHPASHAAMSLRCCWALGNFCSKPVRINKGVPPLRLASLSLVFDD